MMVDGGPRKTRTTPTNDNISAISLVWVNPLPVSSPSVLFVSCVARSFTFAHGGRPLWKAEALSFIVICSTVIIIIGT